MKVKKEATLLHALIPIIFLFATLAYGIIVLGVNPHIILILSTIVATLVAVFMLNQSWEAIEEGIFESIKRAMRAILILMIIGTIVGTWILSGTVPTMIYYGLQILSPSIYLLAACIICCIVSLATGSSWTTAGTVGIALIGIGAGLGIPMGMSAGAIVSGAYFGDKMSPLSDTTNLAPPMAGTTLFEHIKHMLYTTVPALIITLILYGLLGLRYVGKTMDYAQINTVMQAMSNHFVISPLLLLPPVIVIIIVVMKVPAIPGLLAGSVLGGIFAAIFQGSHLGEIITAAHYGFEMNSGVELVDKLLSRGGLDGMMWTVSLILCALAFGGVLEKTGLLAAVAKSILKLANSTGSLVFATILTCIAMNMLTAEQYIAIIVPGRMFQGAYKERGIHPKVLSRALEGGGTVVSPLVPWSTCGAYMAGVLGVATLAYLPFAFLNLLIPIINVIYGYTGYSITMLDETSKTA